MAIDAKQPGNWRSNSSSVSAGDLLSGKKTSRPASARRSWNWSSTMATLRALAMTRSGITWFPRELEWDKEYSCELDEARFFLLAGGAGAVVDAAGGDGELLVA